MSASFSILTCNICSPTPTHNGFNTMFSREVTHPSTIPAQRWSTCRLTTTSKIYLLSFLPLIDSILPSFPSSSFLVIVSSFLSPSLFSSLRFLGFCIGLVYIAFSTKIVCSKKQKAMTNQWIYIETMSKDINDTYFVDEVWTSYLKGLHPYKYII